MALERFIPSDVPTVKVALGSAELPPEAYADLTRVTVSDEDRGTSSFELAFVCWDKEKMKLSWADDARFALGGRVTISMGYIGVVRPIMVGEITSMDLDVEARAVPMLTVRGYDLGHKMSRTTTTHHYTKLGDLGIADEIAKKYQLKLKRPLGEREVIHESVAQYNQTDLEFLRHRAELLGYEVKVDGEELVFAPRKDKRPPALELSAEADLVSFSGSLSAKDMVDTVEVFGWDQAKKQVIKGSCDVGKLAAHDGTIGGAQAKKAFGTAKVVVVDAAVTTAAEAEQIARGRLEELERSFMSARCTCFGRADLRAGAEVRIEGLGERFGGTFDIRRTSHVYDAKSLSYRTELSLRRNAT